MPEDDKVGHLLKGIAEDVYTFLISKEHLDTVSDVIRHCRKFEALKKRRITPKFGRLSNVTTVASVDSTSPADLAATIRQIVREELRLHEDVPSKAASFSERYLTKEAACRCPCVHSECMNPSINAASIEPYRAAGNLNSPYHRDADFWRPGRFPRNLYADSYEPSLQLDHSHSNTGNCEVGQRAYQPDMRYASFERSDTGRRPPVCYRCGMTGHIQRFCRRRRQLPTYRAPDAYPQRSSYRLDSSWHPGVLPTPSGQNAQRSGSPSSDRSLTPPTMRPRRSPSPRRRPMSPPPGN